MDRTTYYLGKPLSKEKRKEILASMSDQQFYRVCQAVLADQPDTEQFDGTTRGALLRACIEIEYAIYRCTALLHPQPEDEALTEELYRVLGEVCQLVERADERDRFFAEDERPRNFMEV